MDDIDWQVYIQDLEAKLKSHTDTVDLEGDTTVDLRKEIAKLKESHLRLNQHTSEIEARLAKSDTRSSALLAQIERHEKDAVDREQAYRDLERHAALLDTSKENKLLLEELVEKDKRISSLERQIEEQSNAQEDRERLLKTVAEEKAIQLELQSKLASLQEKSSSFGASSREPSVISFEDEKEGAPHSSPLHPVKVLTAHDVQGSSRGLSSDAHVARLELELQELATKCAQAESRYAEAELQIAELTTQLSEAKLIHAELDDVLPESELSPSTEARDDISESDSLSVQTPRESSPSSSPIRPSSARRGSSAGTTLNSALAVKHRDFRVGRGFGELQRVRPQSLSQELSSAQLLDSPPVSWNGPSALRLTTSPSRQSLPAMQKSLRSSQSLEAELRFVHEVRLVPACSMMA